MELLENDLVMGSSGKFGKRLVFRQKGGKTIIASKPRRKKGYQSTDRQIEIRELFAEGVLYARGVVRDEEKKAIYQAKVVGNQTAFNLAMSDYCKPPKITKVTTLDYTGQIGDKILVRATDDFRVESVHLSIKSADDSLIEEGDSVLSENGADWVFAATALNPGITGSKLTVTARDLPGNIAREELTL